MKRQSHWRDRSGNVQGIDTGNGAVCKSSRWVVVIQFMLIHLDFCFFSFQVMLKFCSFFQKHHTFSIHVIHVNLVLHWIKAHAFISLISIIYIFIWFLNWIVLLQGFQWRKRTVSIDWSGNYYSGQRYSPRTYSQEPKTYNHESPTKKLLLGIGRETTIS